MCMIKVVCQYVVGVFFRLSIVLLKSVTKRDMAAWSPTLPLARVDTQINGFVLRAFLVRKNLPLFVQLRLL